MATALAVDPRHAINAVNTMLGNHKPTTSVQTKARAAAEDFEAVFLNTMFQNMFTGISGEGPFGGDGASGVWRSFLTDEYAKSIAKAGGIGIADQVYRALIERQAAQAK